MNKIKKIKATRINPKYRVEVYWPDGGRFWFDNRKFYIKAFELGIISPITPKKRK